MSCGASWVGLNLDAKILTTECYFVRKVRADLHRFGFRPDLSRRGLDARVYSVQGREQQRPTADSIATDIMSYLSNRVPDLGRLSNLGLFSFQLYATALSASEPLAEHILVGAAFGRDANSLIVSTLKAVYTAPSGWAGNETLSAAMSVLRILASISMPMCA